MISASEAKQAAIEACLANKQDLFTTTLVRVEQQITEAAANGEFAARLVVDDEVLKQIREVVFQAGYYVDYTDEGLLVRWEYIK